MLQGWVIVAASFAYLGLLFAIVNALARPVLFALFGRLILRTLGLAIVIVNFVLFWLVSELATQEAPAQAKARIVHQHVDGTVSVSQPVGDRLKGPPIAEVSDEDLGLSGIRVLELGGHPLKACVVPCDEHEVMPALGELGDELPADACAGSGDEGDGARSHEGHTRAGSRCGPG